MVNLACAYPALRHTVEAAFWNRSQIAWCRELRLNEAGVLEGLVPEKTLLDKWEKVQLDDFTSYGQATLLVNYRPRGKGVIERRDRRLALNAN